MPAWDSLPGNFQNEKKNSVRGSLWILQTRLNHSDIGNHFIESGMIVKIWYILFLEWCACWLVGIENSELMYNFDLSQMLPCVGTIL